MSSHDALRRRDFLAGSGAFTLAAATGLTGLKCIAAEAVTPGAVLNVLREMEAKGAKFLSIPVADARFLNLLVKAARARNVLEIGTAEGYAALWIGLGLEETGGHLTTIEIVPERAQAAKASVQRAGLAPRVTFHLGDAHKIVPTLDGPFDFVFFDADKDGQVDYFNSLFPKKLAPGALLVAHSAIRYAEPMKEYLALVAKHPGFDSVILSAAPDEGLSVSYRKHG